jgi:hypothetical protein
MLARAVPVKNRGCYFFFFGAGFAAFFGVLQAI